MILEVVEFGNPSLLLDWQHDPRCLERRVINRLRRDQCTGVERTFARIGISIVEGGHLRDTPFFDNPTNQTTHQP
jgi:hypothetical protein